MTADGGLSDLHCQSHLRLIKVFPPVLSNGAAGEGLDVFCANDVYCGDGLGLKDVPAQGVLATELSVSPLAYNSSAGSFSIVKTCVA